MRISNKSMKALTDGPQATLERIVELERFIRDLAEATTLEYLKRTPGQWIRDAQDVLEGQRHNILDANGMADPFTNDHWNKGR